jgi:hypothetical protein
MINRVIHVALAGALTIGCSKGEGGTVEYKGEAGFVATVPTEFKAMPVKTESGGFASVSLRAESGSEVFFSWNTIQPASAGLDLFKRHSSKSDLKKIVEESEIANGKYIHTLRGEVTFMHSIVDCGGVAIECTVSNPVSDAHRGACKSLRCAE